MSSFFPDASGQLTVRYKAEWDEWTSQFNTTLAGFGWLTHFAHRAYAVLESLPTDSQDDIAALRARNALRKFLRESVLFSRPGNTGVFTLSPASCRALQANPPPCEPTYHWVPTAEQTHDWAADQARGRVDLTSYELQATSKVNLPFSYLPAPSCLCSPPVLVCALPSGSG
jgi:hypothetical protein